jgi:hypothetical protein
VKRTTLFLFLSFALSLTPARAQDSPLSGVHGSVTAGYRFTDVSGRTEKYNEFFDLRKGFRVHDFTLYNGEERKTRVFDSFFLTGSGMGGEPFSGGQFTMKKNHVYDLRVNYQQSYFYWDRNDEQAHPTGLHGLLTNHDWTTVRKIGSVNLATYVTENLRLNFEYQHAGRTGPTDTTRTLDYFGAPSTWASFLRANPYVVEAQLDEDSNRTTVGLSYSIHDFSFFYRTGYQWFHEDIDTENLGPNQRSINIDEAATARELLTEATWTDRRELRTPVSEFSYNGRLTDRLRLRGGYIFYRYHGPRSVTGAFSGSARTTGTTVLPYSVSFSDQTESHENTHVLDQGFSYEILPRLNFHADYRYFRYNIESDIDYTSTTGAAAPVTGSTETEWRQGFHMLDVALEFRPIDRLQIRPGIRLMKRDVVVLDDGVADPLATRRSKIASPILTVYYSPSQRVMLRGDVQTATNGSPYTRISPRRDVNVRWISRYELTSTVSIENNLRVRTADYSTSDFRNAVRTNSTNITFKAHDKLSLLGGFTYDSFLATASITFLRGTAPLNATWRDQTVNRVWQAGIDARPVRNLTLNLTGNYLRTTGVGEISGEPPTSGPVRWPFVTGTASYEFPRVGQLSIDLQRTYYIEEIMRGDDFGANLLNLRWTKEF